MASGPAGAETRQRLLRTVKKEVKQIMEEAVTRKFVHEDSSHIISFCAAVEACVLHGLRRRAAGFLRSNKIAALFMKVGKSFPPADELSRKVQDLEQLIENARNQIQGLQENVRKLPKLPNLSPLAIKHLWIRTALFEKVLDKIVHYLVENSSKYYEKEALLMDPVDGPILASLLVGPCALEYTKMKTADHFWTDPSADELVQRHRIHSSHLRQDSPTKRPALCIQKRLSSGSMDDRPSLSARDYVESLHQNSRATLLYGKNNVLVQKFMGSILETLRRGKEGRMVDDDPSLSPRTGLAYCRHLSTVRTHLSALVNHMIVSPDLPCDAGHGLTAGIWEQYLQDSTSYEEQELLRLIYYGGIQPEIRKAVWPFLLGHYQFGMTEAERKEVDEQIHACYAQTMSEWLGCEAIVRQRERESHAAALAKCSSGASLDGPLHRMMHRDSTISNESSQSCSSGHQNIRLQSDSSSSTQVTFPSEGNLSEEPEMESLFPALASLAVSTAANNEASPVSSSGVTYSPELLDLYTVNLHRIEKDVQRCDRNYWYFTPANLEKLRNIMCSYIWQHIEIGYVQGMCDLLAPLLVILDDEALTFSCFTELMKRMNQNFPHGGAMDTHFANMRSLIQILDSELFELMHQNGDYTHFYFCYRWFLLDFKRELVYDDVFSVWETIWAAKHVSSTHYVLFIALALVEVYRDIILENNMDFTDIIKFFNEMAERHNTKQILKLARDLVYKVQTLIENK
ncbi:small G protein signaling modulator 1 [Myotis lucifugus]|uniref:small G protein signaling modulator 1 n=1 Tax=Myotis lucifugus TaxID=59463 RepID=UPI000CCC9B3A|nr:small G protein signaling modulator 1 [Myotis lucifugus]